MSLELKKGDQIIFAVDTSGSMGERDPACSQDTKYHWMQETLASYVTTANKFDPDGVSLYFFSHNVTGYQDVTNPEQVVEYCRKHKTGGGTNTHLVVEAAYREHAKKGSTSTLLLVWTDGDASDRDALAREIVSITNRITNPEEFRIVFLPVGTVTPDLNNFLNYLDEGLTGAKYDIVAVVHPDEADFETAIAEAIDGTTTNAEAQDGNVHGKKTTTVS